MTSDPLRVELFKVTGKRRQGAKKPIKRRLQRSLRNELARASERMRIDHEPNADDVHEARKAIRRVRAWLRWSKDRRKPDLVALDAELKAARTRLSSLRDAGSSLETIDRIRRRLPTAELRLEMRHWREALAASAKDQIRGFAGGLGQQRLAQRLHAATSELKQGGRIGRGQVSRATLRSLARARQAALAIDGRRSASLRHAARRAIRLLSLQLVQARALGIDLVDEQTARRIDRLAKALGAENDLAVLSRRARRGPIPRSADLCRWIDEERQRLIERNDRLAQRFDAECAALDR